MFCPLHNVQDMVTTLHISDGWNVVGLSQSEIIEIHMGCPCVNMFIVGLRIIWLLQKFCRTIHFFLQWLLFQCIHFIRPCIPWELNPCLSHLALPVELQELTFFFFLFVQNMRIILTNLKMPFNLLDTIILVSCHSRAYLF